MAGLSPDGGGPTAAVAARPAADVAGAAGRTAPAAPTTPAVAALVGQVYRPVTSLGPGRRLGIWFQGCTLACPGCMSRHTWEATGGRELTVERFAALWRAALADGLDGLTVSGGEPLEQPAALAALLAAADAERRRAGRPADLLVYTGWEPEELAADPATAAALDGADAVITGRYRAGQPTRLAWRGSANQQLTTRTALGRERYAPYLDHRPERPELQVRVSEGEVRVIGVPRPGDLGRIERDLVRRGVTLRETSWRP
ncbi:4Fe-4S cluster-binding domain-containing protein [Kitasatospora sp. MBT66]|uniref:4Fe-4S cluster-binding domain-containing protein n=1 Tax=Kitasatospora sp. MBT66 TaxID=1444769 RepID=UPI000B268870|nr:4Fe-4S cluster-binding domain-containing protein [Kitasatospora sp. MBT66]